MIPDKINSIFTFIEYLHSNIKHYSSFEYTFENIKELESKKSKLKPKDNFKDKTLYDKISIELNKEYDIIKTNITNPLIEKITFLNICDNTNVVTMSATIESWNLPEIENLKSNFTEQDVNTILFYKKLYKNYKRTIQRDFYQNFFFTEFDKILNELFNFFTPIENKHFDSCKNYSEKIDYWLSIKIDYLNDNPDLTTISIFEIPEHFYNEYFNDALHNPEFTFIALKERANLYFNWYLKEYKIEEQIKSPIGLQFINAELNKIKNFNSHVDNLIHEKIINYTDKNIKAEYYKETELMRIKSGFYKKNELPNIGKNHCYASICYAEHFLLKEYLESEMGLIQNPYISGQTPFDKLYEIAKVNFKDLKTYLESKPNHFSKVLTKDLIWIDFKTYLANKFNLNENNIIWEYVTNENLNDFLITYFEKLKESKLQKTEIQNNLQIDNINVEEKNTTNLSISKLDFTKEKLRTVILELSKLNGYDKPSSFLDELLVKVKTLNDYEFTCNFFLNIHHLCKEHQNEFWSEGHKKDITKWLNKARFNPTFSTPEKNTPLFSTTWESEKPNNQTHIEQINETPIPNIEETLIETKNKHPERNPNFWNEKSYELFKYLFDNYFRGKIHKELLNIWFYLRHDVDNEELKCYLTKDDYLLFIKDNYNIKITNKDKTLKKYDKIDLPKMKDQTKIHLNSLKYLAEH